MLTYPIDQIENWPLYFTIFSILYFDVLFYKNLQKSYKNYYA